MAIYNDISSLIGKLAKQPLGHTYQNDKSLQALPSQGDKEEITRSAASRNSFSGSGLSLDLALSSGKEIDLEIRVNQAGGISQLELSSNDELSTSEQEKLRNFLVELSESVDSLFSGKSTNNNLFAFANKSGISDLEFNAYQDDGTRKKSLEFEKEGHGNQRKIEAQWFEYDRSQGIEEKHNLSVKKQVKREDQSSIYGQMNYQWLLDQVDTAMSVMDDKTQGRKVSAFFNSGIKALFSTAQAGSSLLQDLGASAQQAKDVIGRSIRVLASEFESHNSSASLNSQEKMNGLPDFTMAFSSQRKSVASIGSAYQLNMNVSQISHQLSSPERDESYQTQNRRLKMDYQTLNQKAIYEYTWMRDESLRNIFDGGKLSSSHYRIDEKVETKGRTEGGQKLSYQDRNDIDHL